MLKLRLIAWCSALTLLHVAPAAAEPPAAAAVASSDSAATELRSPVMLGSGVAMTTLGAAAFGVGLGLYLGAQALCDDAREALARRPAPSGTTLDLSAIDLVNQCASASGRAAGGIIGMVGGGTVALAGVPLVVLGAWQVPVKQPRGAVPGVAVGATSARLRWSF
jgi:hypothetical protein